MLDRAEQAGYVEFLRESRGICLPITPAVVSRAISSSRERERESKSDRENCFFLSLSLED